MFRKKKAMLLVIAVLLISIIGIVAIGSATHIYNSGWTSNEYASQKMWLLIGIGAMFIFSFIDYEMICKFHLLIYILNLILLIAVIIIGKNDSNSVTRWISIGPIGIQPSEFAKIFSIISLSSIINVKYEKINRIPTLLFILVTSLIPAILIMKEPSLSASIVILLITFIILFVGCIDYKYILKTVLYCLPVMLFLFWDTLREDHLIVNKFLKDYQIDRITSLIKADQFSQNFYQTKQSMFAIGSGQIWGKGLYNGTINRLNYLPESHNDFIFSVISEEFGFVGCLVVLGLLFFIIMTCIDTAKHSSSFLGKLLASGIAGMFAFQTAINVGVVTGILPNTGMPLPFVSYGGSSMLVNMISIGIIINLNRISNKSLFSPNKR